MPQPHAEMPEAQSINRGIKKRTRRQIVISAHTLQLLPSKVKMPKPTSTHGRASVSRLTAGTIFGGSKDRNSFAHSEFVALRTPDVRNTIPVIYLMVD